MPSMSVIRREFERGDHSSACMLDQPVYESWQRCSSSNLSMDGQFDYGFLSQEQLKDTLLYQKNLLDSAHKQLDALYQSLGGAGWSVLFTDRHCHALKVYPSKNVSDPRIVQAFRQGAVLSEDLIGTSAMSCAIASKHFVRVYGEEHYKAFHRTFNCAAVPVFGPLGAVCASVDITNEASSQDNGAYYLLEACARRIQIGLIRSLPDAIVIELQFGSDRFGSDNLVLAFSCEQTLVGANQIAQRLFKLDLQHNRVCFDDLFDEGISVLFDKGLLKAEPFSLTLLGGISLQGRVLNVPDSERTRLIKSAGLEPASAPPTPKLPYFGDRRIQLAVDRGLKAVGRLPVLVLGESGVGKDVVAQLIHESSRANGGEFVSLNCASIPEALVESELFGYERGAFTGASREGRVGKVQQANGGTLFLDEIGDMPVALQTRLLRVLETREVIRLGASKAESVNFQLICATNRDLSVAIAKGEFRQDLFYRINGYELQIPPLRVREDVVGVAQRLLDAVSGASRQLSPSAQKLIAAYPWPGNVRELRNAIIFADTLAQAGRMIEVSDFPDAVRDGLVEQALASAEAKVGVLKAACDDVILDAVERCGSMTKAAKYLGIGRATLYRKMAKLRR